MERNPYASPRANVAADNSIQPSEWQRAKWIYGGLWILLTLLPILNGLLQPPPEPDWAVLLGNSIVAAAAAGFLGRDMWHLKVRRAPLIVDIAVYAIILGGLAALIVLKETELYAWNDLHLDVPVFLFMGSVAITAWITEAKKGVRVYVGARHLIFVPNDVTYG